MAAANGLFRHLVGGRHHAHVHLEFGLAAQPPHLGIFQDAQQLGLRLHGHFADFVQQQGAVLRHFETAGAALRGAGERAFLVSEKLAFDQGFRQRGAVDGDERPLPPRAERVHGARHQLLAGAAFAGDQHASLARSGLLQEGKNLLHFRRRAHQFAQRTFVAELPLQVFVSRRAGRRGDPARRISTSRDPGWMGFSRNQYAPSSCTVWTAVSMLPKAVRTMVGGISPPSRRRCRKPKPSRPGMLRSVMITSAAKSAELDQALRCLRRRSPGSCPRPKPWLPVRFAGWLHHLR